MDGGGSELQTHYKDLILHPATKKDCPFRSRVIRSGPSEFRLVHEVRAHRFACADRLSLAIVSYRRSSACSPNSTVHSTHAPCSLRSRCDLGSPPPTEQSTPRRLHMEGRKEGRKEGGREERTEEGRAGAGGGRASERATRLLLFPLSARFHRRQHRRRSLSLAVE